MNIRVKITRLGQPGYGKVLVMDLEDYLIGVVSSEMSDKWPMEALKAQAVAARTFALRHMSVRRAGYDVDDTTKYQAYKHRKPGQCPNVERAVRETAGQVLLWGGKPASTNYSSSNGGRTRSAKERWGSNYPYLPAQPDPWDKASGTWLRGHGVGMSQRGAQYAANQGVGYVAILAFYYPGCRLAGLYGTNPATPPAQPPEPPKVAYDPDKHPLLKLGSRGDAVRLAQELLEKKGYALPKSYKGGKLNGFFWIEMYNRVRAYQRDNGLLVDGKIGKQTWSNMLS